MRRIGPILIAVFLCGCGSLQPPKRVALDLNSPEATVVSFTKAAARGDNVTALACFLPGGVDYQDTADCLANSEHEFTRMLRAVDRHSPMPVVSQEETPDGISIVWRVTFRQDVRIAEGGGHVFQKGSTYDLDASLKKSGDRWLIDNL